MARQSIVSEFWDFLENEKTLLAATDRDRARPHGRAHLSSPRAVR